MVRYEKSVVITGMLLQLGYEVETAPNGMDALKLFRARPEQFDLVITDITMPYMTGKELAKELLKIRPDIPIAVCSGYSNAILPHETESLGIRDYLMKPFNKRKIAETINKALHPN